MNIGKIYSSSNSPKKPPQSLTLLSYKLRKIHVGKKKFIKKTCHMFHVENPVICPGERLELKFSVWIGYLYRTEILSLNF